MDGQLGIVFAGGEGPAPERAGRIVCGLAEKPLIAAADSGLILAEAAGLEPDWIIGDMDSLDSGDRLLRYPAGKVIRHPADKDFTDTELAFALLRENGCGIIWIMGGGGGRLDHLLGIRDLFERDYFPRRWITDGEDIRCIDGGGPPADSGLAMDLASGAVVSVFPLGSGPWEAESLGLKWPLGSAGWQRGFYGLSNVAVTGEVKISAGKGRFMIILEEQCQQ